VLDAGGIDQWKNDFFKSTALLCGSFRTEVKFIFPPLSLHYTPKAGLRVKSPSSRCSVQM
jgi:hypothetical protein